MAQMNIKSGGRIRWSVPTKAAEARLDGTPVEIAAGVLQTYAVGGGPIYLALETAVLTPSANAASNTKTIVAGALGAALMDAAVVVIAGAAGTTLFDTGIGFAAGDFVYAKTGGLLTNVDSGNKLIGFALPGTTTTSLVMEFFSPVKPV